MRTSINAALPDLRNTLDSVSEFAIIGTDLKANINYANQGIEKLLGFAPAEIIGYNTIIFHYSEEVISFLNSATPGNNSKTISQVYEQLTKENKGSTLWTLLRKGGQPVKVTLTVSLIKDDCEKPIGYLLIATNTHKQVKAQQDLLKREEKVLTLINNLKDIFFQTNDKGTLIFLNSSWSQLTDFSMNQSLGTDLVEFIHPEDRQTFNDILSEILGGKIKSYKCIKRLLKKDGSTIWAEFNIQALDNDQEEIEGIIGSFSNITERITAENTFQSTLTRFSTLIHYMQEGILAEDAHRNIVLVNEKLCNVFDLKISAEFLKGTSSIIFMDQVRELVKNEKDFFDRIEYLIENKKTVLNEEITLLNGRTLERDYIPIVSDKKYNGHLWQYRDITKKKQQEQELIKAKENAMKSVKAKDMFLSTMSHEIRTPLNAVIGMTHLLIEDDPTPQQLENLKTLKFSAENLMVLINDILDYNKIDAGQITFETIDFSIKDLITGIRQSLIFRAEEKGISLLVNIDPMIPEVLLGDPVRLAQIINNLVSNAVKFTDHGDVKIDVLLENLDNNQAEIKFMISDTGIGIPEDKLDYIFYSFTQASYDITRKFGGTGLGLAITKRLIKLQGGDIKVESKLGQGSKFFFTLRYKISNTTLSSQNLNPYGQIIFKTLKGTKVLLVEDSPINKLVATKFLSKWEVSVDFADNGLEALEKVKSNQYNLVLMDLQMPEMDGYSATKTIRNFEGEYFSSLPIIALTASAMLDVKDQVLTAGMNDYLTKPFNPNELYLMISKYSKSKI